MEPQQGWTSPGYRTRNERPAYAFRCVKTDAAPVNFITVIVPEDASGKYAGAIDASFVPAGKVASTAVNVKIGKRSFNLQIPAQDEK